MAIQIILSVSILLQLASAILALRLIPLTGRRAAWALISLAIFLMTLRRCISFVPLIRGEHLPNSFDLGVELVALLISLLMFAGIAGIAPLFRTFERSTAALKASDRMKSELISTTAHELNTPLTSILGYTEILLNPDQFGGLDAQRQREFLKEIYLKGEALSRVITRLLDLQRLESGQPIPLDLQICNMGEVLKKQVDYFQLHHRTHSVQFESVDSSPILVRCDLPKIIQVLENLIGNAVKYSPAGSRVKVSLEPKDGKSRITVADQGIGMSGAVLAQVFDKFYRADNSNTAVHGLGLGMSVVKYIVEAHKGQIQINSTPGVGTQVSFTLPALAADSPSAALAEP
jgi:signal transduction histidine kinase